MKMYALLLAAAGLLIAAEAPQDEATKKELEKMQGDWVMVESTHDGKKMSNEDVKLFKRTVKNDRYTITRGGEVIGEGTFKLDPTKKPKTIEAVRTAGPDKDKPMLGIYEVEGDTYKVCLALPGEERPKAFESKEGTKHTVSIWKKAGK